MLREMTYSLISLLLPLSGCVAQGFDSSTSSVSALDLGATPTVRASELLVQDGKYCWAHRQDFDVRYENHALPANARVELHYGDEEFGNCSDCVPTVSYYPWNHIQTVGMAGAGSSSWEQTVSIDDRGGEEGGGVEALNYVFKITMPDGSIVWDNGGNSPMGYYRSRKIDAPAAQCGKPAPFAATSVERIAKW
jgi:hypothetical protein